MAGEKREKPKTVKKKAPAEKVAKKPAPAEKVTKKSAPAKKATRTKAPAQKVAKKPAPAKKVAKKPAPAQKVTKTKAPAQKATKKPAPAKKAVDKKPPSEKVVKKPAAETGSRKKIKPELSKEIREDLEKRKERKDSQPAFKRGEWFRYKRLGTAWRRPRGVTNKMRRNRGYRPPKVRIGFGKPASVRFLHPSGFEEVLVHNIKEMESIDPKVQAARIGSTVGTRKRTFMIEVADKKGIRVLNRGAL